MTFEIKFENVGWFEDDLAGLLEANENDPDLCANIECMDIGDEIIDGTVTIRRVS